jgi:hypothetical protein
MLPKEKKEPKLIADSPKPALIREDGQIAQKKEKKRNREGKSNEQTNKDRPGKYQCPCAGLNPIKRNERKTTHAQSICKVTSHFPNRTVFVILLLQFQM